MGQERGWEKEWDWRRKKMEKEEDARKNVIREGKEVGEGRKLEKEGNWRRKGIGDGRGYEKEGGWEGMR